MSAKTQWSINPIHSEISFKLANLMISNVKGVFNEYDASIETKENNFSTAKIVFWINLSSLETGDNNRNNQLKSADFFDLKKYKKITFVSDKFEKSDQEDNYNLWGYLTMKGITNRIKLDVKSTTSTSDQIIYERTGFSINGKISRKDWNLNWQDASYTPNKMGSDEVQINCNLELLKIQEPELKMYE